MPVSSPKSYKKKNSTIQYFVIVYYHLSLGVF